MQMLKETGLLDANLTAKKAETIFDMAVAKKFPIIAFDEKSDLVNLGDYIDGTRKTSSVFMLSISLGRYKKQKSSGAATLAPGADGAPPGSPGELVCWAVCLS